LKEWLLVAAIAAGSTVGLTPAFAADPPGSRPAPPPPPPSIYADLYIGDFSTREGTLEAAIDALGSPTTKRRRGITCHVAWRQLAARMDFYNLGGENPCRRESGHFSRGLMKGDWVTGRGLAIGDSPRKLRRIYPKARFHRSGFYGSGWWLRTRRSPFGLGGTYPGLLARMRDGHVSGFVVRFPAGGD
jgi:hypothetical protein